MDPQNAPWWLTNEAIAVYITVVVVQLLNIIIRVITRKRPSLIRIQKEFQSELITIEPEVKERLHITYDEHPIDELHQAIFSVTNKGSEEIVDVDIFFQLTGFSEDDFLEVVLTNREEIQTLELRVGNPHEPLGFQLPFLNPHKHYEDYLGITMYASKPIQVQDVTGKGPGWTTRYQDKAEILERLARAAVEGVTPLGSIVAVLANILARAA